MTPLPTQIQTRTSENKRPTQGSLGQSPPAWPNGAHGDLFAELAAAVATGDKDQVFMVAAQLVRDGAPVPFDPVRRDDELWPIEEVARRLDMGVRTLDRHLTDPTSDIPRPLRIGGRRKWTPDQIAEYLGKKRTEGS